MLGELLTRLQGQITNQLFSYSVVIVDNDSEQSGRPVAESFQRKGKIRIDYHIETEKNIALARNKAVKKADGNFLALIDDDEYPTNEWLLLLYSAITKYQAAGVLGPVLPQFEVDPPAWVVKSGLCNRERFSTGTFLTNPKVTRTGNALLSKSLFIGNEMNFDPRFGLSGGEDTDFFKRMMAIGNKFVWCDEAYVYETVPAERLTREFFVKRALLRGVTNAQGLPLFSMSAGKSIIAVICYGLTLPLFFFMGQGVFMMNLIRLCDHLGKVLAIVKLRVITKRAF